jgi:hypothetical protein
MGLLNDRFLWDVDARASRRKVNPYILRNLHFLAQRHGQAFSKRHDFLVSYS